MEADSFRVPVRRALAEIDSARAAGVGEADEAFLAAVCDQLEYYLGCDTTDPESHAYPPPGALETIRERLAGVVDRADDPAAEHLQSAERQLSTVVSALEDRLHEGRYPSQ